MTTLVMVAACTRIEKLKKKEIIIVDQKMIATTTVKVLFLTPKLKIHNNFVKIPENRAAYRKNLVMRKVANQSINVFEFCS